MVLARFGLTKRPFATGPDPAAYFPAAGHEEILDEIAASLEDGEPYVLLTGEPGVGKTLLAHLALSRLGDDTATALVPNCHLANRGDLLQAILYELGLPHSGRSEQELRLALTEYAMSRHRSGMTTVLVLDEAHLLPPMLLEEVRLLGNLESPRGKALQVLLVAQPGILATLEKPELAGLSQRLVARLRLEPFGLRESAEYIAHQIARAGGKPGVVFTDEAGEVLARGGRGIPRLLNQGGRAALTIAARAGLKTVDVECVMEALAGLAHAAPLEPEPAPPTVFADEPPDVEFDTAGAGATTWQPGPFVDGPKRFEFAPLPTY